MSSYMRFYDTDAPPLLISEIHTGLRESISQFEIDNGNDQLGSGYLMYGGALHAEIEINAPGTESFNYDWEADKLNVDSAAESTGKQKAEAVLRDAQRMVFVRVRWGNRDPEHTLSRLDVLWDWLFANRSGLLHIEGEGFYEGGELILAIT